MRDAIREDRLGFSATRVETALGKRLSKETAWGRLLYYMESPASKGVRGANKACSFQGGLGNRNQIAILGTMALTFSSDRLQGARFRRVPLH